MENLVSILTKASRELRYDDDAIDRLSHRYTSAIFVIFAVLSTMQQFVGQPISCWVPNEFTGSHTKYANNFCWVKNTYWLPFEEEVPKEHEEEKRAEIIYYQWMPFLFLLMALFFHIPHQIWRAFNSKSGVDSDNIMDAAISYRRADEAGKEKTLRLLTNQLDRVLTNRTQQKTGMSIALQKCLSSTLCCLCGKSFGNYLLVLYLFTKALYIANVFAQLFIMNSVLRTNYNIYGAEVVHNLLNAEEPPEFLNHTVFPKVTMCDFNIRRLGNVHRYTVQCLLPINLYTEKMFIFAWFWMVMVLFFSVLSLLQWCLRAICQDDRVKYIRNHLTMAGEINDDADVALCYDFVQEYLRQDGVFLFRMIGHNTDAITVNDTVSVLWNHWNDKKPATMKPPSYHNIRPKGSPPPPPPKPFKLGFNPLKPSAPPSLDHPDNGIVYKPTTEEDVC